MVALVAACVSVETGLGRKVWLVVVLFTACVGVELVAARHLFKLEMGWS